MTRPCEGGLWGPERLCGFRVREVSGAPSSGTVSGDPGDHGLPPTNLSWPILPTGRV